MGRVRGEQGSRPGMHVFSHSLLVLFPKFYCVLSCLVWSAGESESAMHEFRALCIMKLKSIGVFIERICRYLSMLVLVLLTITQSGLEILPQNPNKYFYLIYIREWSGME